MKVPSYKEVGEKVQVYTPSGSFAFRKSDIKRIVPLGEPAVVAKAQGKQTKKRVVPSGEPAVVAKGKQIKEPRQQVAARKRPEPLVEKKVAESQPDEDRSPADQLRDSLRQIQIWSIMDFVQSSLYQVRYLIGLLAFGKVLKLFLIGSVH